MNSAVVSKLSSRSGPLESPSWCSTPWARPILTHYGTREKDHYLPRLAKGIDMFCFALTEPNAGSDAGAMSSSGEVFERDGELWVRLNWRKRYITLAAISTVLGLAFRLRDPNNHLGKGEDVGITRAPILRRGRRAGQALRSARRPVLPDRARCRGPSARGRDRRRRGPLPGLEDAHGVPCRWPRHLPPASSTANVKMMTRLPGAYAAVRKQFGIATGKPEVEEGPARIAGKTYILEAARRTTCGGLDDGAKPPW